MIWVSAIAIAALSIILGFAAAAYEGQNATAGGIEDPAAMFALVFFGVGAYGTLALMMIGTIRTLIYSRKKLLRILKNYYEGEALPRRITRSKTFLKFMNMERKKLQPQVSPEFYLNE